MVSTIRCTSLHAESVKVGTGDDATFVMVPAGDLTSNVDLNDKHNARLADEGLIIAVPDKKSGGGSTNRGGDA